MNTPSPFLHRIRQVFRPPQRGVVGLVDNLLGLCQEQEFQLDWLNGQCRICAIGSGPEESIEVPLPKSVFRAVLARLAALCSERNRGSVSPYDGEGELTVGVGPATVFRVAFTNTPDAQGVRLTRIGNEPIDSLLLEAVDSGEPIPVTKEYWEEKKRQTAVRAAQQGDQSAMTPRTSALPSADSHLDERANRFRRQASLETALLLRHGCRVCPAVLVRGLLSQGLASRFKTTHDFFGSV